jgi:hypothetical protein
MSKRLRINLLAAVIITGGGIALSGAPALAAVGYSYCDDMMASLDEKLQECADMGGTRMRYDGACTSNYYSLNTVCYFD